MKTCNVLYIHNQNTPRCITRTPYTNKAHTQSSSGRIFGIAVNFPHLKVIHLDESLSMACLLRNAYNSCTKAISYLFLPEHVMNSTRTGDE